MHFGDKGAATYCRLFQISSIHKATTYSNDSFISFVISIYQVYLSFFHKLFYFEIYWKFYNFQSFTQEAKTKSLLSCDKKLALRFMIFDDVINSRSLD